MTTLDGYGSRARRKTRSTATVCLAKPNGLRVVVVVRERRLLLIGKDVTTTASRYH